MEQRYSDVMQCGHCGNRAPFEILATTQTMNRALDEEEGGLLIDQVNWRILRCPACTQPVLQQIVSTENTEVPWVPPDEIVVKVLYPSPNNRLNHLPDPVSKAYQEALSLFPKSPAACAVQLARTLEATCKHEGAMGKDLYSKLNALASSGRIPEPLAQMGHQVREFRNLGAHADDEEVSEQDVPVLRDYVEAILEYMFDMPVRIDVLQKKIDAIRARKQNRS